MSTTPVNPITLFAESCNLDEKRHVARGLLLLIEDPENESEFKCTARAILNHFPDLEKLASDANNSMSSIQGLLDKNNSSAIAAMLIKVSNSYLNEGIAGVLARRYLAALAVEIVLLSPSRLKDEAIAVLARIVRSEIKKGTSHSAIPNPSSLFDLVAWLGIQPQSTSKFSSEFWKYWRSILNADAWGIINAKSDYGSLTYDPDTEAQGLEFSLLPEPEQNGFAPNVIVVPEPVTNLERKRSAGTERVISDAQLSTYTPLYSLSECSTTILTDNEVKVLIKKILRDINCFLEAKELQAYHAAIGRLLILVTGTSPNNIADIKWIDNPNQLEHLTEGISLDGSWFLRREYIPENAVGYDSEKRDRFVWIPIPNELKNNLNKINSEQKQGKLVLSSLHGGIPKINQYNVTDTALRRTFFSRISRLEPLGITGAQWACGDSFGIDISPIYYDRYSADALATLIEKVTFPWFGDKPGKARAYRPKHYLGSRVPISNEAYGKALRENIGSITSGSEIDDIIARVNLRTWNLIHGIVISTGHRPNNNFNKLTLKSFDLIEGIGILSDKVASPSWQHRPVSIAEPICTEIKTLIDELKLLSLMNKDTKLGKHAALAISGKGPLFIKINSEESVEWFGIEHYLQGIPTELLKYSNFARHWLNQFLIGRASEMLRVGQLGWHGVREGAWSSISPISVREGCKKLHPLLTMYLKSMGWRPLGHSPIQRVNIKDISINWIDSEHKHERQYQSKVNELKRADAARQMQAAKLMLPDIQFLVEKNWPNQFLVDERFQLQFNKLSNKKMEMVSIGRMEIEKMAHLMMPGDPRRQARSIAFNVLSLMFRVAKKRGLIEGQIPHRRIFSYGSGPGLFLECAPMALTACRSLENWLMSAENKLTLPARTLLALLHFGSYTEIDSLVQVLKKDTLLVRLKSKPDVILAQTADQLQTFAFHGKAALHLARWRSDSKSDMPPLPLIEDEIYRHLPDTLRPDSDKDVLRHLAALARVRNSLVMDGIARHIGTEKIRLTTISATRIAALHDNHPVTLATISDYQECVIPSPGRALGARQKKDVLTIRSLTSKISKCQVHRRPKKMSDKEARVELREWLSGQLRTNIGEPGVEHLLARFAVALLDDKAPDSGLQFITILGYLNVIANPLKTFLGSNPLSQSEDIWQEAFIQIVASSTPDMKIKKRDALLRFYKKVSPHVDLPNVDFDVLSAIAGYRSLSVNPGYLTDSEMQLIADILKKDIEDLNLQNASAVELHVAKARQLYFHIICATTLRPREAWAVGMGEIDLENECTQITIRIQGYQQIKTTRSRRRVSFKGPMAEQARMLMDEWLIEMRSNWGNTLKTNQHVFGKLHDPSRLIERDHISSRINELVRWATNTPNAVAYWTRKSDIHRSLTEIQNINQDSLWPVRDLLSRAGQASIKTTLGSYLHDPLLVFHKWFHDDAKYFDIKEAGQIMNWSASTISRKMHDRKFKGHGDSDIRSRIGALLDSIPIDKCNAKELQPPLTLVSSSKFCPIVSDIDEILRLVAAGQNLKVAARSRSWPSDSINRLVHAVEQIKEYGIGFQNGSPQLSVVMDPPRKIKAFKTSPQSDCELEIGNIKYDGKTLREMADSWLRYAVLAGIDKGVPGTSLEWAEWEKVVGTTASGNWTTKEFKHLQCRLPVHHLGPTTSSWNMLRWNLVLYWLKLRVESISPD